MGGVRRVFSVIDVWGNSPPRASPHSRPLAAPSRAIFIDRAPPWAAKHMCYTLVAKNPPTATAAPPALIFSAREIYPSSIREPTPRPLPDARASRKAVRLPPRDRAQTQKAMLRFLLLACLLALSAAFMAPVTPSKLTMSKIVMNDTPGVKANFQGGSFQDYLDKQKKEKEEAEKKKN